MRRYVWKRVLYAIPTLLGVSIIIFISMRIIPGDPIVAMLGGAEGEGIQNLTDADRSRLEEQLGLADPLPIQYLKWLRDIGTLKLGTSFFRGDTIRGMIIHRAPISAEIGVLALVISWLVGVPVGILSAMRPNTVVDAVARTVTILFLAIPGFWLALMIVLMMVIWFQWYPPLMIVQLWEDPQANLTLIIGPAVVLGLGLSAFLARMTRSSMLEVIRQDYVRTARAKGLMERLVLIRHTLPNALLPVVTVSGLSLGFVLGGSVAIEKAFNVNGLGLELVRATGERDWAVIQNLTLFYGFIFVVVNMLVDLSYALLDPRIRYD